VGTRDQNIPDDWNGVDWACYLVEWPASAEWRAIFTSFIRSLGIGWNWDESSGSVVDAQAAGREIWTRYLTLTGGNDVGCNFSELVQAILDLHDRQYGGCCQSIAGSAGAGSAEADAEDFEDDGANYPDGFADRGEYDIWKCGTSQLIIDLWKADLEYLESTDFLAVTAAFVAAALLTPVPGDEVIALVGVGIALVIEGVLAATTSAVANAIEDNEDELRCLIYNAVDTITLKGSLEDWFESKLTTLEATFMGYLINSDVLNWVFSKVNQILPVADCSLCEGPAFEIVYGTLSGGSLDDNFTVAAEQRTAGCGDYYDVALLLTDGACVVADVSTDVYSTSCLSNSIDNSFLRCNGTTSDIDGPDWAGSYVDECLGGDGASSTIRVRSGVPFSLTVEFRVAEPADNCAGGP